jgi:hypothetical protein
MAVVHRKRSEIDMPGGQALAGEGGNRRQLNNRLGDPATRVSAQSFGQSIELTGGRLGANHESLAARTVYRLDHQLRKPIEDFP